jgi:hypothetical protein
MKQEPNLGGLAYTQHVCCYIESYLEEKSFVMVVSSTEKQKRRNPSVPVMNAVRLKS